jgi:hypothetical protein
LSKALQLIRLYSSLSRKPALDATHQATGDKAKKTFPSGTNVHSSRNNSFIFKLWLREEMQSKQKLNKTKKLLLHITTTCSLLNKIMQLDTRGSQEAGGNKNCQLHKLEAEYIRKKQIKYKIKSQIFTVMNEKWRAKAIHCVCVCKATTIKQDAT